MWKNPAFRGFMKKRSVNRRQWEGFTPEQREAHASDFRVLGSGPPKTNPPLPDARDMWADHEGFRQWIHAGKGTHRAANEREWMKLPAHVKDNNFTTWMEETGSLPYQGPGPSQSQVARGLGISLPEGLPQGKKGILLVGLVAAAVYFLFIKDGAQGPQMMAQMMEGNNKFILLGLVAALYYFLVMKKQKVDL